MNILNHIIKQYKVKDQRGWKTIYWLIDLHDTIIPGTYTKNNDGKEFFPFAKETLKILSDRKDTTLILWTSSHLQPAYDMMFWLEKQGIKFLYLNNNPLEKNTDLCDFTKKIYFNVLLDDKGGFEGSRDWYDILTTINKIEE